MTTLGIVGVLTLLIAIVNYVNLATARAGLRAREVAMRKVLGGRRATLIRQFTGEALATVAFAALAGLALAELALPLVNAAGLYEEYYKADAQRARLFTIGAVLAVLIGCIGLYGLAAFDTSRRVKEIGIRKTLGASTADVLRLLLSNFLRPVLVAGILAWPVAYVAMQRWLAGFDDQIVLSPWYFVAATFAPIVIAAATIFSQAWRVARSEPAVALRHE